MGIHAIPAAVLKNVLSFHKPLATTLPDSEARMSPKMKHTKPEEMTMTRILAVIFAFSLVAGAQTPSTGSHRMNDRVQSLNELESSTVTHATTVIFGVNNGLWNTSQSYDPCVPDPTADPLLLLFSGMAAPPARGPQQYRQSYG